MTTIQTQPTRPRIVYGRRVLALVVLAVGTFPLAWQTFGTSFLALIRDDVLIIAALLALGLWYSVWMAVGFWRDPTPRSPLISFVLVTVGSILPAIICMAIHMLILLAISGRLG